MMPRIPVLAIAVASIGWLGFTTPEASEPEVRIEAGAHDRQGAIAAFDFKGGAAGTAYIMRDGADTLPLQVDGTGRAWARIPVMARGSARTFRIATAPSAPPAVTATRDGDQVAIAAGVPVLRYVGGKGVLPSPDIKPIFARGGYLHPVRTPSGRVVTDEYPADHRHHYGIWFAWTRTRFQNRAPDFWNVGDGTARVEFAALQDAWSGAVHGGVIARHRYIDLTSGAPITVLEERWTTRVFAPAAAGGGRPYHAFDVDVSQTNVTGDRLELPEYHYGGIGVRGASSFVPLDNLRVLTSELKDRLTGDGAESRWAVMSGAVDGAQASLAVLAHPGNFRAPERMRIHPIDPYLCFAPSRSGPWAIAAGAVHTARYRFIAFDGAPDAAELQRLWRDYAQPPTVTLR